MCPTEGCLDYWPKQRGGPPSSAHGAQCSGQLCGEPAAARSEQSGFLKGRRGPSRHHSPDCVEFPSPRCRLMLSEDVSFLSHFQCAQGTVWCWEPNPGPCHAAPMPSLSCQLSGTLLDGAAPMLHRAPPGPPETHGMVMPPAVGLQLLGRAADVGASPGGVHLSAAPLSVCSLPAFLLLLCLPAQAFARSFLVLTLCWGPCCVCPSWALPSPRGSRHCPHSQFTEQEPSLAIRGKVTTFRPGPPAFRADTGSMCGFSS